jgi:hypothetical protein
MKDLKLINWEEFTEQISDKGFATIPGFLSSRECDEIHGLYSDHSLFRKTVIMERHRFGKGEYKYFGYPLPQQISKIRDEVYFYLVDTANLWNRVLKIPKVYPKNHQEFLAECKTKGQELPAVLMLKYGSGGFNTLHQDLYGEEYFPLQIVLFLSEPDRDYTGGEFVLTQQVPRAQSKAIVLRPKQGDLLIVTTNYRPEKGNKGYYRVNVRHGVSEVIKGKRYTLGIIFHDAKS